MSSLKDFVSQPVKVLTIDGHLVMGNLEGYDQNTNVVLTNAIERVFSPNQIIKPKPSKGVIIRGDDIISVGTFDNEEESQVDYSRVFADKINDSKNCSLTPKSVTRK
ncbi:uncharacterized protein C5L36_0B03700 [Pichia kudriavzevii]|uniref:LSM2-LSM8 complex subunit LSM8 n=1 Tax=Pichia kudriavzevii TaxID=4909 RepID=A0A099P1U5_PICKU|nr:uncharacterized protein C5L36_0B03700 [Pichia kudriavzevii]AWU75119.1 hypothetical protein C5L36_0B03700 [Pichia kudriavzevii]KGK38036.1 hypothetical protein JL09_g2779 [Pichia kudriavzevii]